MKTPESEAQKAWRRSHNIRVVMGLNRNTDKDILDKLETVESKQGYIKELIRRDLAGMKEPERT